MLPTVATAVGADRDAVRPPLEAIADRMRERGATLVVLDDMEHLLAAVSHVAALLDAVPDLCVLVTSQAPLHVATECCLPLDALDDEAALTLIERVARRQGATTSGATADRAALLEVVRLLDGLPLALELAAVRLSVLTPAQLRDRLRDSPDLLKDTRPGRLERHRSLRATVEWTLELLDEAPRALFTRLGAFAGPVELEEVEAVAGADALNVLEAVAGLLDVALLHRVERGDGRMRFGLPEALRRIASGMLDAAPDGRTWRKAHAERQRAIAWAARALSASAGADYRAAVAADAEAAAALRWARGAADPVAGSLGAARAALLADNGRTADALAVLEPLLATPSGDPVVDGQARFAYAHALCNAGRLREAATAADQVLTITSDPTIQARALVARAWVHSQMNEHEAAVRVSEHATALARGLGPALHSGVLMMEAQARLFAGGLDRRRSSTPRPSASASRWTRRGSGDARRPALISRSHRAAPEEALEHYALSLEAALVSGNAFQIFTDLTGLAYALAGAGHDVAALEVAGLASAQGAEVGASSLNIMSGGEALAAAEQRLGPAGAEHRARGIAVPTGGRVARACALAHADGDP